MRPAQAPPPPRTARLLGRDRTLADIRHGLERGAIVTLVGPHGVGKSELALHVLATREGDDHVFVDLLHARDEDDVVAAIAASLDVRVCSDALAAVREALIARGGLLVLDRGHHLPTLGEVVRALRVELHPAILCTSTHPLGTTDERVIPVDPLEPTDAVDLFLFRFGRPIDSTRDQGFVRDLVLLCGCIPAAIELCAASRESPLQLLRELEVRVPRDRELLELVEWSLERLDSVSRHALARASLIEGSFSLATFAAIVDLPSDVAPPSVLSSLAERALVARSPHAGAPFQIMPIVRRIAEATLSDRDRQTTLVRHAEYFAKHFADDVVERSRERADLVAGYQTALAYGASSAVPLAHALLPALRRHGPLELARGVVEATLTIADDPLLRAERAVLRGEPIRETTDPRSALLAGEALLDRDVPAVRLFREAARDPELAPMALRGLAESLRRSGELDEAASQVERALSLAHHRDRPTEIGDLLTLRASIELDLGDLHGARADLVEALTILGDHRDERAAAAATTLLAEVQGEEGLDPSSTLESALDLARRAGDLRAIARVELVRAVQALVEGRLDLARGHVDAAERYEKTPQSASLHQAILARGDHRVEHALGHDRALARLAAVRRPTEIATARSVGDGLTALTSPLGGPVPGMSERIARRILSPARCVIAVDGARASLAGVELDLERRPTLKQILALLLRVRIEHPGRAVSTTDLFAAGWPGEKLSPGAKGDRVRAALQALRDLGLRGHLVTLAGGWALDSERAYDVT